MTYEIINATTGNTVASFEDQDEAFAGFRTFVRAHEGESQEVALIAFDDEGEAQELFSSPLVSEYA